MPPGFFTPPVVDLDSLVEPAAVSPAVGQLLGERIVINEFVGCLSLTKSQAALDSRSVTIATYALCGVCQFRERGQPDWRHWLTGPDRRKDFASLGFQAMIGGLLACYLTACIVAVLGVR